MPWASTRIVSVLPLTVAWAVRTVPAPLAGAPLALLAGPLLAGALLLAGAALLEDEPDARAAVVPPTAAITATATLAMIIFWRCILTPVSRVCVSSTNTLSRVTPVRWIAPAGQ